MHGRIAVKLFLALFVSLRLADIHAQAANSAAGKPGKKDKPLPPLIRSIIDHMDRMEKKSTKVTAGDTELLKDMDKLKKDMPITVEVTIGDKSCTAKVQGKELLSAEGDRDLLDQYELDDKGMVRDIKTGERVPSAKLKMHGSSSTKSETSK